MQIQISCLQKPTDLDLHCLLRQGMSCLAREGLRVPVEPILEFRSFIYYLSFIPFIGTTVLRHCGLPCLTSLIFSYESVQFFVILFTKRQHLFAKIFLKRICCCKESLISRKICQKKIVLFLFLHRTYVFGYLLELPHWGDSNKYPKYMFLDV